MSTTRLVSIFWVLLFSQLAIADQVVLKNGDRITGTIVKSDGKSLTLKSEFAGTVSIPMDAIVQISSDQQLHVVTKEGQTITGSVSADANKVEIVRSADKETLAVARGSVVALRSNEEQATWKECSTPTCGNCGPEPRTPAIASPKEMPRVPASV